MGFWFSLLTYYLQSTFINTTNVFTLAANSCKKAKATFGHQILKLFSHLTIDSTFFLLMDKLWGTISPIILAVSLLTFRHHVKTQLFELTRAPPTLILKINLILPNCFGTPLSSGPWWFWRNRSLLYCIVLCTCHLALDTLDNNIDHSLLMLPVCLPPQCVIVRVRVLFCNPTWKHLYKHTVLSWICNMLWCRVVAWLLAVFLRPPDCYLIIIVIHKTYIHEHKCAR